MTNKIRDAVATMGTILTDVKVGSRDAVHVACIAVTADRILKPGDDVGVDGNMIARRSNPIGIVDPFLKGNIMPKEKFWLYLYPRTITGLNHHWTHPAFPDAPAYAPNNEKKLAIDWINQWLHRKGLEHWDFVGPVIKSQIEAGRDDICFGFDVEGDREFDDEFWDKVEIALDMKIAKRPNYYRCAC